MLDLVGPYAVYPMGNVICTVKTFKKNGNSGFIYMVNILGNSTYYKGKPSK